MLALLPLTATVLLMFRAAKGRVLLVLAFSYLPLAAALPIATGPSFTGVNLWVGTWERDPYWIEHSHTEWPSQAQLTASERAVLPLLPHSGNDDDLFLKAAIERYKVAPLEALSSWFVRYRYLWIGTRTAYTDVEPNTLVWFVYKGSMWLLNLTVLLLGLAGGILALRRRDPERTFLVPIAYVALIYLPFHSTETRYSIVALPFLLALAIYALGDLPAGALRCRERLRSTYWRMVADRWRTQN